MSGSPFARAAARLFARLGAQGVYRFGDGRAVPVQLITRQVDVIESFGQSRLAVDTQRFDVQAAEVAQPVEGDILTLHGNSYRVIGAPLADRERLVWTLTGASL